MHEVREGSAVVLVLVCKSTVAEGTVPTWLCLAELENAKSAECSSKRDRLE